MLKLWENLVNVLVKGKLKLGPNASIVAQNGATENTISLTELTLLDGATFATAEANMLSGIPTSVTGTMTSTATSASCAMIFLNATTGVTTAVRGRAFITTTASGTTFGVVSGITANAGAIANVVSGAFDFVSTVSGRININIVNGASSQYVTFNSVGGKQFLSPVITTS